MWLPVVHPLLGTWHITQAYALTGNRTCDPLVCRPTLNPLATPTRAGHSVFKRWVQSGIQLPVHLLCPPPELGLILMMMEGPAIYMSASPRHQQIQGLRQQLPAVPQYWFSFLLRYRTPEF